MIKKAWTPDNCPLQVGSVIYDPITNSDRMVIRRLLSYEDNCADEDKNLVILDVGTVYSGKQLMENRFTYYPEWPCNLEKKPCYDEVKEKPDIVKLAQCVFEGLKESKFAVKGLKESKFAVKGLHYKEEGNSTIWADDLHDKVSDTITELVDIFMEGKHDEQ